MKIHNEIKIAAPLDQILALVDDVPRLAGCVPGAELLEQTGLDTYRGRVKVKLGPIALVYNGSGTFVEKDEAAHRFVVDAKGRDKRGNGTAGAKVTLSMSPAADGGATDVEVVTDLSITGKPAQFGRGVMQDVSDKLLGQFVECLERRLSAESTGAPQERPPTSDQVAEAAPAPDTFSNPATEARARSLQRQLRCLVCQNKSLADSNAELARDLRLDVFQQMQHGKSDAQIKQYLVARYSDFVLYDPPLKPDTWLLWFGPLLILFGGAVVVAIAIRKRNRDGVSVAAPPTDNGDDW